MKRILALLLLLSVTLNGLTASEADDLFKEANRAFKQKDFIKATDLYEKLWAEGYRHADLAYNLGNAWYRQGSIGRAILYYERALILQPNHPECTKNLAFVRSKIEDEAEPLPEFLPSRWWRAARVALPNTAMGIVALSLWWSGFGALALRLFSKTRNQKKWSLIIGIVLLLISLLPFSLAISRAAFEKNTRQAILLQKSAILRAEPDNAAPEVLTLSEGSKLGLLNHLEGWWQVRLVNGETGWLAEQTLERI